MNSESCPSYHAFKTCTYTDSAGRPVPAPHSFKQERQPQIQAGPSNVDFRSPYDVQVPYPSDTPHYAPKCHTYPFTPASATTSALPEQCDDDRRARKRFRNSRGNTIPSEGIFLDGPILGRITLDRPTHVELDCSLTRELINRKLLSTFNIFPGPHGFISLLHPLPSCSRYHSQALVFECSEPEPCPSASPVRCLCTCCTLVKATPRSHEPFSLCGETLCSGSTIANV